jgi:glycosyltransferase involved in cell wall biosynthesis
MRVLFVSDAPTVSGAELVMLSHIDALLAVGSRAHVVLRHSNHRLAEALAARQVAFTACDAFSREDIRTTFDPAVLAGFARSFIRTRRVLRTVLGDFRADVIHCVSYPAILYAVLGRSGWRTPLVWHEHNIKRLHPANRAIIRYIGGRCHWVLGPSDAVTNNLAAAGVTRAKLRTIYNGVNLALFVPSPEAAARARQSLNLTPQQLSIGLPGQMLPYKGHQLLIDAAGTILGRYPDVRFYFIGALENPPYQAELERRLRASGLDRRFVFTGWRQDIHEVLQAMQVVVVPTVTPEPAALTLIEAMALERPLVATRTGGTAELVIDGETGLLVDPGDVSQLSAAILRLLDDPALGRRLGEAGRRWIEQRFTMAGHQAAILELYDAMADDRR